MDALYIKYNRHRLPRFQIETTLAREGDRRCVIKRALTPEAEAHLRDMTRHQAALGARLVGDRLRLPAVWETRGAIVRFEYVEGHSLDRALLQAFGARDPEAFYRVLDDYQALLRAAFAPASAPALSDDVRAVVGEVTAEEWAQWGPCVTPAAIDAVFENILVDAAGRHWLLDNEWVFDGALPLSFLLFRGLYYFYHVKYADLGLAAFLPFDALLARVGIAPAQAERYRAMDERFQAHVFGAERCYAYKQRYLKPGLSVPQLGETIEHQRDVIRQMHDQIVAYRETFERQERTLREMHEMIQADKRLLEEKDRQLVALDRMIAELRQWGTEKERLAEELHRLVADKDRFIHDIVTSRGWRWLRRITGAIDRLLPPGSRRRAAVARCVPALRLGAAYK